MDGRYNVVVVYKDSSSLSVIDRPSIRYRLSINPVLTLTLFVIETMGWGPLALYPINTASWVVAALYRPSADGTYGGDADKEGWGYRIETDGWLFCGE